MMLFIAFASIAFALADGNSNNNNNNTAPPSLREVLNSTTHGNINEYVTLLGQHQDLFDLLSSPPPSSNAPDMMNSVIVGGEGAGGGGGMITILIPNNDAFRQIPYSGLGLAFKMNDSDTIRSTMEYHVLSGLYPTSAFNTNGSFSFLHTWLGNETATNVSGGQVVGAVQQSPGVTIFTSGLGSRSSLVKGDVAFRSGVVHVIDTFLTPPPPEGGLLTTAAQFNLTAFAGALVKTNLLALVDGIADITVFAPTDAAFETVGGGLEGMEGEELERLMRYHVVVPGPTAGTGSGSGPSAPSSSGGSSSGGGGGDVRGTPNYSPHLTNNTQLPTILSNSNGPNAHLTITVASNSLFVNSARITQLDILLANGVLHVIDNVLSPNDSAARPVPSLATQLPVISVSSSSGEVQHSDGVPFTTDFPASATAVATKVLPMTAAEVTESFGINDVGESGKGRSSTGVGGILGTSMTLTATSASASASASAGVVGKSASGRGVEVHGGFMLVLASLAMEVVMTVMGCDVL